MTEKFESNFHKRYVGGEGEVEFKPIILVSPSRKETRQTTLEEVLAEYRRYVNDPLAELPENIVNDYLAIHRTENDGEQETITGN